MAQNEVKFLTIIVTRSFILVKHDIVDGGIVAGIKERRATDLGEKIKVEQGFGLELIAAKKALKDGTEEAADFLKELTASKEAAKQATEDAAAKAADMSVLVQEEVARQVAALLATAKPAKTADASAAVTK